MKKLVIILLILIITAGIGVLSKQKINANNKQQITSVIVGSSESTASYKTSLEGASLHYRKVREAENALAKKEYDKAVRLLKESIPFAKFKFEKGAVYYEIAEIYKKQGDSINEIKYRLLIPEYTENDDLKRESQSRAEELQKIISRKM